jgi:hypothetical protein
MNSMNFIIKESKKGYVYSGCQAENFLYVISQDDEEATQIELSHQPQCGSLVKDDSLLAIGCTDGHLMFFSLDDPAKPTLFKSIKVKNTVTALEAHGPSHIICG